MMQTDVKRLVAYSSVSHMGFVILGIFTFTMQGTSGAVMQMVNHGLSTGLLFFVIGVLYERTHTRDLSEMGGLATVTPWIAAAFLVATLSSIGLPGLNNFVGEFLVILGSFGADRVLGALAVSGRRPRRDLHALGVPARLPGSGRRTPPGPGRPAAARARGRRPGRRRDAGARRRAEPGPGPDQPVLGRGGGVGAERRRRPARACRAACGRSSRRRTRRPSRRPLPAWAEEVPDAHPGDRARPRHARADPGRRRRWSCCSPGWSRGRSRRRRCSCSAWWASPRPPSRPSGSGTGTAAPRYWPSRSRPIGSGWSCA